MVTRGELPNFRNIRFNLGNRTLSSPALSGRGWKATQPRRRATSKQATAAAADTFSDSVRPRRGMDTSTSQR